MLRFNYDTLGIATTIACAIHCALMPIFLSSLTILGINLINNPIFEVVMIGLAAIIGYRSLIHGFRKHHTSRLPISIFAVGILLLVCKQIWHQQQLLFLIPAIIAIISAHVMNIQSCRKSNTEHAASCRH